MLATAAAVGVFVVSAIAQTPGRSPGRITPPPGGWMEQWIGMFDGQDRAGRVVPPGFKVIIPRELPDAVKAGPHEPDEIEVVESLMQPWARARSEATDYELEDSGQICRPLGLLRGNQTAEFELLTSPEKIMVITWNGGGILTSGMRRIYLNRPHRKNPPLTYMGDSVGHWEGDTLVIDTVGFNDQTWLSRERGRHSEALHVAERWRFVVPGEWLEKTITVDDRFALTAPYTMTRYFKRLPSSTPVPERLCQDTPESRRAWVKLYQRNVRDWDEGRKNLGPDGKLTGVQ